MFGVFVVLDNVGFVDSRFGSERKGTELGPR